MPRRGLPSEGLKSAGLTGEATAGFHQGSAFMPDPAQRGRARVCASAEEERVQARRRVRSRRGVLVIRSYLRCYPRILHGGICEGFRETSPEVAVGEISFALVFGGGRLYVSKKRSFA